jgi:coenzyme F420-0:L-glutamate ligase / coenzyme F420-1:gamma-L-glutamate ligase
VIPLVNFVDEIKARRSVRKYAKKTIPKETIRSILEIATFAPSAHNAQPWRFMVLAKAESKKNLANSMAEVWLKELERDHVSKETRLKTVEASIERFTAAPVLIVACLTLEDMDSYPDAERQQNERDLAVQSLSAAIQTLLLAAHAKGLGACWYCAPIFCKSAVRKALAVPESVEPQALITLGYPVGTPKVPSRNPIENYVHLEKW